MGMVRTAIGDVYIPDGIAPPMPPPGMVPPPVDASLAGAPGAPQYAPPPPPPPPPGNLAPVDFTAPPVADLAAASPNAGAAAGARIAGDVKFQKKQAQREAAQAAYAASPEGQIEQATQGTLQEMGGRQAALEAQNAAEQAQLEEQARIREEGAANAQAERERQAKLAEERAKGMAERQAAYEKAVDAEANYKVDDGRRWRNLSTGKKVLAGISVVLAGLGEALQHKSGPNPALAIIMNSIKDDVDAQVRDRDQLGRVADRKRNSLDMYRQQTNDLKEAGQLKLAEEYKRTADQMEATAAKYAAPQAKARMMDASAQLRIEAQKILGGAAEARFGRDMQRGQLANARAQVGLGYANLKQGKYEFQENLKIRKNDQLIEAAKLEQAGKAAQAKALREQADKDVELGLGAPPKIRKDANGQVMTDDTGTPLVDRGGALTNADGTTFHARNATEAAKLADQMAGTAEATRIMDRVLAIRDRVGGESSLANSDEFQQLKTAWGQLKLISKDTNKLGALSESDITLMDDALGAGDATSFRDKTAGIEEARNNVESRLNSNLQANQYSGPRVTFPKLADAKAPGLTAEDATLKAAVSKPSGSSTAEQDAMAAYEKARKMGKDTTAELKAVGKLKGITPDQEALLGNLERSMTSGTPQARINARLALTQVAQTGQTEALRQRAINALVAADAATTEETGASVRGVARDTIAAPPPAKKAK